MNTGIQRRDFLKVSVAASGGLFDLHLPTGREQSRVRGGVGRGFHAERFRPNRK